MGGGLYSNGNQDAPVGTDAKISYLVGQMVFSRDGERMYLMDSLGVSLRELSFPVPGPLLPTKHLDLAWPIEAQPPHPHSLTLTWT